MGIIRPTLALTLVFLILAHHQTRGGEILRGIYIASHDFVVTVSPVDEESRNAESADLYQRASDGQWKNAGLCKKISLPSGDVRFVATVSVDRDGTYEYTSRPVVGGKVSSAPQPGSPPQAVVVVDTLPPLVTIIRPEDPATMTAGESLDIVWKCEDENSADLPGTLFWSPDGGDTWQTIGDHLTPAGEMIWRVPDDASGASVFRLAAIDKAGNVGTALRQARITAKTTPQPPAEEIKTKTPPVEKKTPERGPAVIEEEGEKGELGFDRNRSWLYYLMAVNLMRQNNPREALRYYWLSVKEDPNFVDARADIALAYIDVGAYRKARDVAVQAREFAPERIDLMHLMGETYHAEGMDLLGRSQSREDRAQAKKLIDEAVEWYGQAVGEAASEWRESEQAASLYRLGEISYYINMDPDGARAYWRKILDLHTPAPNSDLVLWSAQWEKEKATQRYQRYTYLKVSLDAWQNWARGYLEQLDARERAGIVDLMPAQRISAATRQASGACGPAALTVGREDGRSLFSLPTQLGSPDPVPASAGYSQPPSAARNENPAQDYSFYAPKNTGRGASATMTVEPLRRGGRSQFSGGPDPIAQEPVDPYSFPQRNRPRGAWNTSELYGDKPIDTW